MDMVSDAIREWEDRTRQALLDLNVRAFRKHQIDAGADPVRLRAAPDDVLLVSMHKVRIARSDLPNDVRVQSVNWLRARGF